MTPQPVSNPTAGFILLAALLALYFVPLIVALTRDHHQRLAIGILNLVAGWSVLGWIIALVWACTVVHQAAPPAARAGAPPRSPGTPAPRPRPRFPVALEDALALRALRSRSLDER